MPFLIFYHDPKQLPHAFELQQFYENFNAQLYPEKEICMAGHKCKSSSRYYFSVFVVQYNMNVIHAVDGLHNGIILVPVNGNFLLKIYKDKESYSEIVFPMLELQSLVL